MGIIYSKLDKTLTYTKVFLGRARYITMTFRVMHFQLHSLKKRSGVPRSRFFAFAVSLLSQKEQVPQHSFSAQIKMTFRTNVAQCNKLDKYNFSIVHSFNKAIPTLTDFV